MKVIIAGSRGITDYDTVFDAVKASGFILTEVVSGMAKGVDTLGELYAASKRLPVKQFPANWELYGKRAGYKRNAQMGDYADAAIAIRLNNSRGTSHMIEYMLKLNKPVFVVDITG